MISKSTKPKADAKEPYNSQLTIMTKNDAAAITKEEQKQTPSQAAWAVSWKSDHKNMSHPLHVIEMSGQELKFMDVRPNHDDRIGEINAETGKLNYEMFWSGEADELDKEEFLSKATALLAEHGGEVTGKIREAGCMISMVAVPFAIPESDAMALGRSMFDDFGRIVDSDDEKEEEEASGKIAATSGPHADNVGIAQ